MPVPPRFSIDDCNEIIGEISPKTGASIGDVSQASINLRARAQLQCAVALVEHIEAKLRSAHDVAIGGLTAVDAVGALGIVHKIIGDLATAIISGRPAD